MSHGYDHRGIEKKWQSIWADQQTYKTPDVNDKPKRYVLDMFPYPSGAGLHVGHPRGFIATDVIARYLRAKGHALLHPMGWDAFGLPAENYAIKTGTPPQEMTDTSIKRYREQLQAIGMSYDWSREVNTSAPEYYRWTQWLFLKLFENDLAYQKEAPVNWCPNDQTVLANEQVVDGKCDRCKHEVIQRNLTQWFLRITKYANELVDDLQGLDWPESTKLMQHNWIGRKHGIVIRHKVTDLDLELETFSAFPAWLFADTFVVIAPNHPLVTELIIGTEYEREVTEFIEETQRISAADRVADRFEKKGVFTGRFVQDPFLGKDMPVWVANFALLEFGTGIIRCSAHDIRDYEFATKYQIPTREVVARISADEPVDAHDNQGMLQNSGPFTGRDISPQLITEMMDWIVKQGFAYKTTTYRMRDWLVSRQRYWGAPIPIIHCPDCGPVAVPEDQLPVVLPTDVDFRPTGESPIARSESFHAAVTCPKCGKSARRESDTLDTFVDSSWYFLRYTDPDNSSEIFGKDNAARWMPVDTYVGGAEHSVLHLLYARFITKALADMGYLTAREPFQQLRHQGLIIAEDGRKMSKSYGNVVNPDEIIEQYGADSLRTYEMFMGPFADSMPWSTRSMIGSRRWLDRVWDLQERVSDSASDAPEIQSQLERTVRKVSNDIESFKFNTAISAMMELTNSFAKQAAISTDRYHRFLQLLAPFAPHIAEELYELTGGNGSIQTIVWPEVDEALATESTITLPVQVNGKTRTTLEVAPDISQMDVVALAQAHEAVMRHVADQTIIKVLYVPGKILNLVVKPRN